MKNTKFKVGDKVHIKSREWFEKNIKNTQDNGYYISGTNVFFNNEKMMLSAKELRKQKLQKLKNANV